MRLTTACLKSGTSDICTHISDTLQRHSPIFVYKLRTNSVPASVPKGGPMTINRQPTPTKLPMQNGPKILDFRPVLSFPAALANRRLRPLGHLTLRLASLAQGEPQTLSVREISTCRIQLSLSDLQRFFKPSPSSNSTDKPPDFTMRTHGVWAHSRKRIEFRGRADGARCASLRLSSVSENECRRSPRREFRTRRSWQLSRC